MSGSTISSLVNSTVTLGSSSYASPLTITSAGTIAPTGNPNLGGVGNDGIYAPGTLAGGFISNAGVVHGEDATNPVGFPQGAGGFGGTGVFLGGPELLVNTGLIAGGIGYSLARIGDEGGFGVRSETTGTVANSGTISGGAGGYGGTIGGRGGVGVYLGTGSYIFNNGTIRGGSGGSASTLTGTGGVGGIGLYVYGQSGGYLPPGTYSFASSLIQGGTGGSGFDGGTGGIGVFLDSEFTLGNSNNVKGGTGGAGSVGGTGGIGVLAEGTGNAINYIGYSIIGGTGGAGSIGGAGGIGLDVTMAITAANLGTIAGGAGGFGTLDGGTGGTGINLAGGAYIFNTGTILGGAGGGASNSTGTGGAGGTALDFINGQTGGYINGQVAGYTLTNGYSFASSLIRGGAGGAAFTGGTGGIGVILGGTFALDNSNNISGGIGGAGHFGGTGGIGALVEGTGNPINYQYYSIIGGKGGSGSIGGAGGTGVVVLSDVSVNNAGYIFGGAGGAGSTLAGSGGTGVYLTSHATLLNTAAGTISGGAAGGGTGSAGAGIDLNGGTLVDFGLIEGGNHGAGDAVLFGSLVGTVVVESGARLVGSVVANAAVADLLELAGTSAVVLTGVGTQFENFSQISFAAGAGWTIAGNQAGLSSGETISGFGSQDKIILDGFSETSYSYASGIGLEVFGLLPDGEVTLDISGNYTTSDFTLSTDGANTTIAVGQTAPCFTPGTRILTPRGDIAVEALQIGDLVITHDGQDREIIWIGHRELDLLRNAQPERAQPVLIGADALADGVPRRDLVLSPDHALFIDGSLIPAKALINGVNVVQLNRAVVTYYHIELAEHAVLFAEQMAAESYLETGNRGAFSNGGVPVRLHPDFAQSLRESQSCAPFLETGLDVQAIRERMRERGRAGHAHAKRA